MTPTPERPLLLLDVDGVLVVPDSLLNEHGEVVSYETRLAVELAPWLAELAAVYDLMWNTRWGPSANHQLGPQLGLPRLPWINLGRMDCQLTKLPAVQEFVGRRPMAWIDDDLDHEVHAWAARRPYPTLLVESDFDIGMTRAHVDALLAFATSLGG